MKKKYSVTIEEGYHDICLSFDTIEEVSVFADTFMNALDDGSRCKIWIALTEKEEEQEEK